MKTLYELCKPRKSVFSGNNREDTLDLDNLLDDSINPEDFFNETYITEGMKILFDSAFERFKGTGQSGLLRLTQSMGGGKTHAMIGLALLSKYPELRKKILTELYGKKFESLNQDITVVSYTGRNSDIKYGIWGEIAEQLGKCNGEFYKNYCEKLSAPGQTAWVNLLKDKPILILLDELPPYLDYIKTVPVGQGTLADITVNALSNLFNALGKTELSNVCVVISDLTANYESGSKLIQDTFKDLNNEIGRSSKNIEPVAANTDDLYMILKKRLFEKLPTNDEIKEIAIAYKNAVNKQRQMGTTTYNADIIFSGIMETYPFHSSIKDLFARFKENVNFQQTRGFIRLTRQMVKNLWDGEDCKAKSQYIINAYDIELNDSDMRSMIKDIKPKLSNAIAHDICGVGRAVAEELSSINPIILDISKLILISSMGDVVGAVQGLNESEIIGFMTVPENDLTDIKKLIEEYKSKAWYLYVDSTGKYFFKDIKNVNAELRTIVDSYTIDTAKKEIKNILEKKFSPKTKDCYQKVLIFPAIDDIKENIDSITLILFEPQVGGGLTKDLKTFYNNTLLKNRFMFLSGDKDTMNSLLTVAKELKGIKTIINKLKNEEHVSETDSQYILALDIYDKTQIRFLSALRETFVTLYYPTKKGIKSHEIIMKFNESNFNVEDEIRNLLIEIGKFTINTTGDEFKEKIESRIFTASPMKWTDVLRRAAETEGWQWYKPSAINDAKMTYINKGYWSEENGMVDKNPPLPSTNLNVRLIHENSDTGEVTLKITPLNGDKVYYEIGGIATSASEMIKNLNEFKTKELKISFICVDSTGEHEIGDAITWKNEQINIKWRLFDKSYEKMCELKVNNPNVTILYTTDGSSPITSGATYITPFVVPLGTRKILAIAVDKNNEIYGKQFEFNVPLNSTEEDETIINIDKNKKLTINKKFSENNSKDTYKLLDTLENHNATLHCINELAILKKDNNEDYISISTNNSEKGVTPTEVKEIIDNISKKILKAEQVNVTLNINSIEFVTGQDFEDWISERKEEVKNYHNNIKQ